MIQEYLEKHKNVKHLVWSSFMTFFTSFLVMFSFQVGKFDLGGLEPSDITSDAVWGALMTVGRLVIIAIAQALQFVILKAGKRS